MKRLYRTLVVLALLFGILLALTNALLGPLNQDEGWYLLAARFTAHHRAPYTDYSFSQAPFFPYFYALFQRLWFHPGSLLGVLLPARLFTAALGLAASALAAALAFLLTHKPNAPESLPRARFAALATWLLTACAPTHSYFSTIPKTYALAALLLSAGFLSLAYLQLLRAQPTPHAARLRTPLAFNAGIFLGLATATRLSLALALPATCLSLWLAAPRASRRQAFRDALFLAFGALFVLALAFGVPLSKAPDNTLACLGMHAVRQGGSLVSWLSMRAGFLSRSFQAYPLLFIAAAFALFNTFTRRPSRPAPLPLAIASSVLLISLLHALAPFPYDDYQTPIMPLFAALLASSIASALPSPSTPASHPIRPTALLLTLALGAALASPLLMDWVSIRKDRFWFELKSRPDVLVLRDAGRDLRALHNASPLPGNLLTQDAYLAVESGLPISPRLAMGPFSFYPDLDSATTQKRRLLNQDDFFALLTSAFPAPVAATSGYTFAISAPSMERTPDPTRQKLLDQLALFYDPVKTIPNFGQAHTTLTLWQRKPDL